MAFDVGEDPLQIALGVDQIRLSIGKRSKSWNRKCRSVQLGDFASDIRQHKKVEAFGGAELSILLHGVHTNTHNLCIELTIGVNISLEAASL